SGVTVTGYRVYYGTQNGSYPTKGCQVTNTSCTVTELKDGQTYHFVARAYNSYGESGDSDPVSYSVPNTLQTFTIEASVGNDGSIDPSGTVSVTEGQSKIFNVSPHSGFHIDRVLIDGKDSGSSSTYTFKDLSANHTIYATFAPNVLSLHKIIASIDGHGSILPQGNVTVEDGIDQNFSITADTGYDIADVLVDGQSVGPKSNHEFFNISEDHTISASFTPKMFTITTTAGSNGSIRPGTASLAYGSGQSFTIAANEGYEIADVLVDNQSQGAIATYTFTDVAHNHLIEASFKEVLADAPVDGNPSDSTSDSGSSGSGSAEPTGGTSPSSGSSNTSSSNGATTDNNSVVSPAVTPAQEFVNQAPDQPGLLYPVGGAQEVSLTPLLEIEGFSDRDADDDHGATRWQVAMDGGFEQLVLDVTSRANNYLLNFLVPDGALCADQLYYWRAKVKDAHEWSDWSEPLTFTTARGQADVNGNGVADDLEPGYSDLDNDGQNDNDQPLMRVYKSRKGQSLIGINAVEGVSQINCFTSIEAESILDEPRPKLRYGLMVFNVTLDQIGATARFELYLPEKPRIESKWYKYDPINGWYEFPVDSDGDKYYIEITDGGIGDADGVVNGIIVDPIGLADMSNEVESVDALDAVDSGDSESTMDRLKNACFIQAAADRSVVDATDAGNLQMAAFRFIYSGLMALLLAVAVIQVTGGRRGNRTHSSPRSNSRSRSA
ncbi:MAG: fibronectin type III domain-containing protein, partial [Desulfobacterales bacterium]